MLMHNSRDDKIPLHEKLPKKSEYYKHYMCRMYSGLLDTATKQTKEIEKEMMKNACSMIPKRPVTTLQRYQTLQYLRTSMLR
jgi:hypothetical protein